MAWGAVVAAFSILAAMLDLVNSGEFSAMSFVSGLVVPGLYVYGAVLNSKADAIQNAE